LNTPPLCHSPRLNQVIAAQLAGLISFLQGCLDRLVIACTRDDHGRVERNAAAAYRNEKTLFPVLQQVQDAVDVFGVGADPILTTCAD
jgi:hypothetical protein